MKIKINMNNSINFIVAFGAGYLIGQTHHGWKYFIFAVVLIVIERIFMAIIKRFFAKEKVINQWSNVKMR